MIEHLTPRELDTIELLAQGYTNEEIGDALCISHRTVQNHVSSIFDKFHVNNRTAAAIVWLRRTEQKRIAQLERQVQKLQSELALLKSLTAAEVVRMNGRKAELEQSN